ncbi:MAG: arsenosugar biosynthesis radical SAM protein ArsS, partial [Gammaproteobacteria bacterium]|nr:arsenosugar biosynthesis radical SAM protein ArsS [Gammaproteobacteria bacterium]
MLNTRPLLLKTAFPPIRRGLLGTLQVNLGYTCNQSCLHCHVNAGPKRKEQMSRENIDQVINFLDRNKIQRLDLTGGAPELNPHFRYLVAAARKLNVHVIDRCNLTILNEPGQECLTEFLAENNVEVVASLPCYLQENVDAQRGSGVYNSSIIALQKLNASGYGKPDTGLVLNLMYNPSGTSLPPAQQALEQDYKKELKQRFNITFNNLYTLANMPIMRFGSTLISKGEFENYMSTLKMAHQDINLETVMCRSLISIDWQGYVYDCDFNQMLNLPLKVNNKVRSHISEINITDIENNP